MNFAPVWHGRMIGEAQNVMDTHCRAPTLFFHVRIEAALYSLFWEIWAAWGLPRHRRAADDSLAAKKPKASNFVRLEIERVKRGERARALAATSVTWDFGLWRVGFAVTELSARPRKPYMEMTDGCGGGPHQGFPCSLLPGFLSNRQPPLSLVFRTEDFQLRFSLNQYDVFVVSETV